MTTLPSTVYNSPSQIGAEQISVVFAPPGEPIYKIDNWTSYSFDSDFFVPTDGFTLEIADDRVEQLLNKIKIGTPIQLIIADRPQMTGLIDKVEIQYDYGGMRLHISGRDLLGIVCDATVTPDLTFGADTTFKQVFDKIFSHFGFTDIQLTDIEDGSSASISSGGFLGIRAKGKSGRARAKNFANQVKKRLKPEKTEGYMEYIFRINKLAGWNIKLHPNGKTVIISPPTYDRSENEYFNLIHLNNGEYNNVISASMEGDWSNQPSVLIVEGATGGGTFRTSSEKVIIVNDITGRDKFGNILSDGSGDKNTDLSALVKSYQSKGAKLIDLNLNLIENLPKAFYQVNQDLKSAPKRVCYLYNKDLSTTDEIEHFAQMKMYEYQNKFLTLHYEVNGHDNSDMIWQPNMLVKVIDDVFTNGQVQTFWIKKRTFTKSRSGGTKTHLELKLPYVFDL